MINNVNLNFVERLINSVEKKKVIDDESNLYDSSEFRNDILCLNDVKARLGQRKDVNLKSLYKLAHYYRHHYITDDGRYCGVPIPTTSEDLRKRLNAGTQQNFSKIIKRGIDIDLLKCVDDTYRFDSLYPDENRSRMYIINDSIYQMLKDWYSEQVESGKISEDVNEVEENEKEDAVVGSPFTAEEIKTFRITSHLYSKPTFRTDQEIREILKLHHPPLVQLQEIIAVENQNRFIQENFDALERVATPSIHREKRNVKRIEGIGLRDTNHISNLSKPDRKILLRNMLGPDYLEYDVVSSIYRVQYLLNNGTWLDDSQDMYQLIYGGPFGNVSRDAFKEVCQRLYFSPSVEKAAVYFLSKGFEKNETVKTLTEIRKAMVSTIGEFLGSEIYLYESRLYAEFALELMKEGFNVVQVFDCMYVNNLNGYGQVKFENHCRQLIKRIAENFYVNVYKWL